MTMFLALAGGAYVSPAMQGASIPLFLCAALDMIVCGCCVVLAIQRQDVPPLPEG
jgi:hypothetical protein